MNTLRKIATSVCFIVALAFALALPARAQVSWPYTGPAITDTVNGNRTNPDGTNMFPKITLESLALLINGQEVPGSGMFSFVPNANGTTTLNGGGLLTIPGNVIGYGTGHGIGASVTQITNRTTGVTITALSGAITTNTASLAAEVGAAFVVTDTLVAINDVVVVSIQSGSNSGNTAVTVQVTTNGSFTILVSDNNASAGTAETGAIIINFVVIKGTAT